MQKGPIPKNIDEYIAGFSGETRERLQKMRSYIGKAAPAAVETISYAIPTYKLDGILVHFAGYKNHIGFYPGAGAIEAFKKDLDGYITSKGTIQLPHDKPLPLQLIRQVVKFRVMQNKEKAAGKNAGKTTAAVKKTAGKDEDQVKAWMNKLAPAVKGEIEAVRKIIKAASRKLSERIKWNAPSYYYKQDILTFGPYKKGKLLLVFHHPAVVKVSAGLLQGDYKDRRLVYFKNKAEVLKNKGELTRVIKEIISHIDKAKT